MHASPYSVSLSGTTSCEDKEGDRGRGMKRDRKDVTLENESNGSLVPVPGREIKLMDEEESFKVFIFETKILIFG